MDTKRWSSTLRTNKNFVDRRFKRFRVNLDVSPRMISVLFAFLEMQFMCVSHDRSEEMSTPRYFAEDTDSSMQL